MLFGGSSSSKNGKPSDKSSSPTVACACFSFLFSELCTRAYSFPDKVKNVEEVEHRLTNLGAHVGTRLMLLFSSEEGLGNRFGSPVSRPTTVEGALRHLTVDLWKLWFGRAADDVQRESNSNRFFVLDSAPMVLEFVDASPDYMDREGRWTVNYSSFMGGVVKGALTALGFECEVLTYHQPEAGKPHQSLFVISFYKYVCDREKLL